jgi:GDPmannose 4,6-dehydratase
MSHQEGHLILLHKVVKTAVEIKYGLTDKLELGNMDSYRDWGHSRDYVKAI